MLVMGASCDVRTAAVAFIISSQTSLPSPSDSVTSRCMPLASSTSNGCVNSPSLLPSLSRRCCHQPPPSLMMKLFVVHGGECGSGRGCGAPASSMIKNIVASTTNGRHSCQTSLCTMLMPLNAHAPPEYENLNCRRFENSPVVAATRSTTESYPRGSATTAI